MKAKDRGPSRHMKFKLPALLLLFRSAPLAVAIVNPFPLSFPYLSSLPFIPTKVPTYLEKKRREKKTTIILHLQELLVHPSFRSFSQFFLTFKKKKKTTHIKAPQAS